MVKERLALGMDKITEIIREANTDMPLDTYFRQVATFLEKTTRVYQKVNAGNYLERDVNELKEDNQSLYEDIRGENYESSFCNPDYARECLGEELASHLCFLAAEVRIAIPSAYEGQEEYLAIIYELFTLVYTLYRQGELTKKSLQQAIYWHASDYLDVFLADRLIAGATPESGIAFTVLKAYQKDDLRYLYGYGEYVGEEQLALATFINQLPEETITKMASVFTEGYRLGFVATGKDLSIKGTVSLRFVLGFERVIIKAIANFKEMGLKPVIQRAASSALLKQGMSKVGVYGGIVNKQFDYDHRFDQGLFFDKKYVQRKLEVMQTTFEHHGDLQRLLAGPAVIEVFGEEFTPLKKKESSLAYTKEQEELLQTYEMKAASIQNTYIPREERSFTIVAYPTPEIGPEFAEIFADVIKINTLDYQLYQKVQQSLIDALDTGEAVRIIGSGDNQTDLTVNLWKLKDPQRETIFENCVADVNIPVGEVFTSPVLAGTSGVLHVSQVYLNELQFENLKITLTDGMVTDYTCTNFDSESENRQYIKENILYNRETLPLGEFAIGTNTLAYAVARKYGIEDKFPILIAEKMGPHFALGDTCYSWSEEIPVYNPDGKEIVARDNACSLLRKEDVQKAYFNCHTDITIPYDEIDSLAVVRAEGEDVLLIKDGVFVYPGTEILNEPLMNKEV
ncbi:aminopeptidase [Lachnospiraceae bacterium PFB1-21]